MALSASVVVESRALTVADITAALSRSPTTGGDIGSAHSWRAEPREWSTWALDLVWPAGEHAGTAGLSGAIQALGMPFADRLAQLRERGCDVVLSVVQHLSDDAGSTGLHFEMPAIVWLARAQAVLDVDQYVNGE